ncbi:MAG: hypothetical protein KIT31_17110 [Deltaproteobacteria bacterium]|nr:hypothetical protein [Deltaproteobacteria bacterium]
MLRLTLLVPLLLSACTVSPAGAPCVRHSDCATAYCAPAGVCATAPADAGTADDLDAAPKLPPPDGAPAGDAASPVDAPVDAPADAPPEA